VQPIATVSTDDQPAGDENNYDFLFGATSSRTIEDAAVRQPEDDDLYDDLMSPPVSTPPTPPAAEPTAAAASSAPPPPPPSAAATPSISAADNEADATRIRQATELGLPPLPVDTARPTVMAVRCTERHLNPPKAARCRVCGAHIPPQDPVEVPQPPVGQLVISNGASVVLDRNVILGRSPTWQPPGERPHLIKLSDPTGELSRNHVEVEIDGWQVSVHDLDSTNGTIINVPGKQPYVLGQDERLSLSPGSVVTLADDVSFVYEAGASS
jgi:hypothetical protein